MDITATLALNNGVHIPVLGLGTWLSEPGEVKVAVEFALKQGYKHVDCAAIYFNEKVQGCEYVCVYYNNHDRRWAMESKPPVLPGRRSS